MSAPPAPAPPVLSRRTFLAGTAGLALLAAGCTGSGGGGADEVTGEQAGRLDTQVAVQEELVAAYASAAAADPALAPDLAELATQASVQLDRLRAAAPSATRSGTASATPPAASTAAAPPAGSDVRAWLRERVVAAAASHAEACVDQSGARAALLGSVAAGLLGHGTVLA
ncbi:hypothetical protein [Geodermatophilus marinus]|uniref:hypothetical protein n=1 Tax=Geodermatophilus sp. LHW52908 TaxID=2303986 RepID=UPI000E3DC7E4|nr:hypothetical protein [Geodermatophilus sp. LHW52908]RFU19993.1 hypothetical protein D0Z06_18775 [Geodermatophilus sp. LHW52908]